MNKTVLITGGAGGIGSACARLFAKKGYNVVIGYCSSEESAQSLARQLCEAGGQAIALRADIAKRQEAVSLVEATVKAFGTIDVLVNNAGVSHIGLFTDITESEWDRLCKINLAGTLWCAQAAAKAMISRKEGSIINISSMWGEVGASCEVCYSATKAAVIGFTKALAKELGPSGIRVNCVSPGVIATKMNSSLDNQTLEQLAQETPLGRIGTPEEVAEVVCFLAEDASSFVTGQVLGCSGGLII